MDNKKAIVAAAVVGIILLAGGGYLLLSPKQATEPVEPEVQEEVVPTIQPSDLGLTFIARADKKAVKFVITNIEGILSVDYEISYMAKGDIPRGAIGHIEAQKGDKTIETKYIDLGTCSSGKCKYDEGVTSVKLTLKITKTDGKVYSAEKTLEL